MNRLLIGSIAATLSLAALSPSAMAQTPAYSIDDTVGVSLGNPPFTLGSIFTANTAVTVTDIGVFDSSQDGLVDSYPVGLWDSGGTLLASGVVSSGTGSPLTNQFRYVGISPVTLTAGMQYAVGALFLTGNDPLVSTSFTGPTNFSTDPRIGFVTNSYKAGSSLSAPFTSGGGVGYFGPNFKIMDSGTIVPEPGAIAFGVLAAGSVLGLVARKRRKG
jgi:hypothetical protein